MLRNLLFWVIFLVLCGGCATYRNDNLERMSTLPHHYTQFDAKLAWEIKPSGNSTLIDGIVQNIRYYEMDDLEIWVSSLDTKGNVMSRTVDYVYKLKENETAQFTLKIPQVTPGTKLRFLYSYVGHEGGGDTGDALAWRQSFEAEAP